MKRGFDFTHITLILFVLLAVSSCAKLYVPPTTNTPLITKQGDGNIDVGATTSSFYVMGGYGIGDRLAFIGDLNVSYADLGLPDDVESMLSGAPSNYSTYSPSFRHSSMNVGLGRYWKLGKTDFVVEAYGGMGAGVSGFTNEELRDDFKNDYFSGFAQLNWGYKNRMVELGMMLRCTGSMFTTYYPQLSDEYLFKHPDVGSTSTQFPMFMWQYGFTGRFGKGRLKFVNSISFNALRVYRPSDLQNIELGLPEETNYTYGTFHGLRYPRASFAVGISYRLK